MHTPAYSSVPASQINAMALGFYREDRNGHRIIGHEGDTELFHSDLHLLLDEHATQIFAMTDDIAERARKIGGPTIHSIGDIAKHQRLKDNDTNFVEPKDMLAELRDDNKELTRELRSTHELCEHHDDVATASLLENWIDETERRTWFLSEIVADH